MKINMIKLKYYKTEKTFGGRAGKTDKEFFINIDHIVRITDYKNSTKINLTDGTNIEVCEGSDEIFRKIDLL